MKRVMIVIPYFYPKTGGLENYAYNIAKGLSTDYNWEVTVITSNHTENSYQEEIIEKIKIYRLPSLIKASNTPINPFWSTKIKKIIKKEKPDVINGHTPVPFISDVSARIAKELHIPFVLTYQNDLIKESYLLQKIIDLYYFILGKKTIKEASKIIATSEGYVKQSKYLSPYHKKTIIIPPGISKQKHTTGKKLPLRHEKSDKVLLFVGQMDKTHRHKGVDVLLLAFKKIVKQLPSSKLILVGKGNALDEYKKLSSDLGIQNHIHFTGYVDDSTLQGIYQQADIVVLPSTSDSEGFGMVLLEAYAAKKPVVASRIGGIVNIVQDKKTGLLAEPKSTTDLAKKIMELLQDPVLANKLGETGYKLVTSEYYWEHQVKKTDALFKTLI